MAGKWEVCVDIASAQVSACPTDPAGWINRSVALQKLGRTAQAFIQLEPAGYFFPGSETILYNLACYACQLGYHGEAWDWLVKAFGTAKDEKALKLRALDNKDFAPFWAEIGDV